MSAIVTSTEVERPAADVFAYATDPTRFRDWQKGVVDGRMDGPADEAGSPTAGSKCLTTQRAAQTGGDGGGLMWAARRATPSSSMEALRTASAVASWSAATRAATALLSSAMTSMIASA